MINTDRVNAQIITAKTDIKKLELEIREKESNIPTLLFDKANMQEQDLYAHEKKIRELKSELREKNIEIRYANDAIYTFEDIEMINELQKEYVELQKEWVSEQDAMKKTIDDISDIIDEISEIREWVKEQESELEIMIDNINILKKSLHTVHRNTNFVTISLSQVCMRMIESGSDACPTYTQLKEKFDNTLPLVSGGWRDNSTGTDIERIPSQYKNYWKFYESVPNWKIITVDPDREMYLKSMSVEIQASNFTSPIGFGNNKSDSLDQTGDASIITVMDGIIIYEDCRRAIVAPDIEKINEVLGHFISNCESDPTWYTAITVPFRNLDNLLSDHTPQWYQYSDWLKATIESLKMN